MWMFIVRLLKRLKKIPQPVAIGNPFAYTRGSLEVWSISNWNLIPPADRQRCLNHLGGVLRSKMDGPAVIATWARQVAAGVSIGSNDKMFHFGAGMQVRNILRGALGDLELPQIRQPNGELGQNWDDFYLGALHALVQQPKVAP